MSTSNKLIRLALVATTLLSLPPQAHAGSTAPVVETPTINWSKALVLDKEVTGSSTKELGTKLQALVASGATSVDIYINSPGGSVLAGFWFIDQMRYAQSRGVEIRCHVDKLAASMAFQILTACSKRYVQPFSILLWHRVRQQLVMPEATAPVLTQISYDMHQWDSIIIDMLLQAYDNVDQTTILFHLERETMHTGLSFQKLVGADRVALSYAVQSRPAAASTAPGMEEGNKKATPPAGKPAGSDIPGRTTPTYITIPTTNSKE